MKQEYRHTKPIRGKDPSFENEQIDNYRNFSVDGGLADYVSHCKTNYLSPYNDGYTRDYYRGELLRLKAVLNQTLLDTENILNGKSN